MYTEIKLEKGLYNMTGTSFTEALERLDNADYTGTDVEGLDAFSRQLKRFDIKVSGKNSDKVEKFFANSQSAALFPEFVARCVKQGISDANIIPEVVAATTFIDGFDYRSITTVPDADSVKLMEIGQGAEIPATDIFLNQDLVTLSKRGRMLRVSYEAIRNQRLDLFAVTLRQIGIAIANEQLSDALTLIIDGTDTVEPAETYGIAGDELAYSDLVRFWSLFDDLNLTTLLVSPVVMAKILTLDEVKDTVSGDYMTTGRITLPFGATLIKTTCLDNNTIVGLDKSCALGMVVSSDLSMESDKLIDRQLERTAITATAGFSKLFAGASKVLVLS